MTAFGRTPLAYTRFLIKDRIKKQVSDEELDSTFLVCGEEGSGKSNFMLCAFNIYEQLTGKTIDINNMSVDLRSMIVSLAHDKRSTHGLDEGEELNNLNKDKIVTLFKKVFVVSRARAQITYISYPNPFRINAYFKEDRAKGLFFCYKRKYVYFYSRETFRAIREIASRNANVKSINDFVEIYGNKADGVDLVPKYNGHLLKEYLERKTKNIDKVFDDVIEELNINKKMYSINQLRKELHIRDDDVKKAIKEGILKAKWNPKKTLMLFTEEDKQILINHLEIESGLRGLTTDTLI